MGAAPIDLEKCAVHTRTNKPWSLVQCCEAYAKRGIGGVSVWDDAYAGIGADEARRIIDGSGLGVPALVRGGFFTSLEEKVRTESLDHNRKLLDDAAELGADMLVLVVGATPGLPLAEARAQVIDGISHLLPHAEQTGVKLAIEPLHPMYADNKSCISRITEARTVADAIDHPLLGLALDVYHIWWDPDLEDEIASVGSSNRIFGFHVCDWKLDTNHLLTDRGLMGDGVIDVRGIRSMVESAGFDGWNEVEVFSERYWAMDQDAYLDLIVERLGSST